MRRDETRPVIADIHARSLQWRRWKSIRPVERQRRSISYGNEFAYSERCGESEPDAHSREQRSADVDTARNRNALFDAIG
jgi:hypothetical protein